VVASIRAEPDGSRPDCWGYLAAYGEYRNTLKLTVLQIGEVAWLAAALAGVRRTTADGVAQWRYHGRLVARQTVPRDR
jgi:hypothetical protein